MWFFAAIIGFWLGMYVGSSDTRTKLQRRLGDFLDARGMRLVASDGSEVHKDELIAELKPR